MIDNKLKDILLISSPGDGGVISLKEKKLSIISMRATTGLAVDKNKIYWAYQDKGGRELRIIDKNQEKIIEVSKERLDLHDVFIEGDSIYVVVTENNEIIKYNKNFDIINKWKLLGDADSIHINSITIYNGRLIASIFGRFKHHREYIKNTEGNGEVIDIETNETLIRGLSQPHSLKVENGFLYLCDSEKNELHIYKNMTLKNKIILPGYARGIGIGSNYLYIGISLSRNSTRYTKGITSANIAVINKATMKIECMIPIPFREIYDVVIINNDNLDLLIENEENDNIFEYARQRMEIRNNLIYCINTIKSMENSRSWRLTKPLRDSMYLYKKLKQKLTGN